MGVVAAVAECERDLLVERTRAGVARAMGSGTALGSAPALFEASAAAALTKL